MVFRNLLPAVREGYKVLGSPGCSPHSVLNIGGSQKTTNTRPFPSGLFVWIGVDSCGCVWVGVEWMWELLGSLGRSGWGMAQGMDCSDRRGPLPRQGRSTQPDLGAHV